MKTTYKILAIFFACLLGYASMSAEYEIYDVDGVKYKVFKKSDIGYTEGQGGVFVVANDDKTKTYSGKINIPDKVMLNGNTYPVLGFEKLSSYEKNEAADLEITLPEGLKVINPRQFLISSEIKSINIPSTLIAIYGWLYYNVLDSVHLRTNLYVSAFAGFEAKHISFEDGYDYLGTNAIFCENDTLILPGSVKCMHYGISDENLKCLHITKSKTGKSPEFSQYSLQSCLGLKSVICEYEVPPTAEIRAFEISKDVYGRATLYVPAEAIEAYRAHPEWGKFKEILPITNGVTDVTADEAAEVIATEYYDLSGRRLQAPAESGITIVATRYSDGSRRTAKLIR